MRVLSLLTFLLTLAVATPGAQRVAGRPAGQTAVAQRAARAEPAAQRPARLSTTQLAGQRIIYAYAGLRPPAALLSAIRAGDAAGVIFFANNVSSSRQLRGVVDQLQRLSRASPVHAPLLMLTDQEGGEVRRLPGAPVASEKQIGASADRLAQARAAGTGAARNLAPAGVNVNLSPVLDVYRHPGNFIDQYGRSYSENPTVVARLGAAFVSAQQRGHVAATAKHFPGLGSAARAQNTDLGPVRLPLALARLRAVDEAPYRSAIASGVKLVMTSWAIYPALDPARPAGLSSRVIAGELRGRLHFHGVTITDGIEAGAVRPFGSLGRRGILAAAAGADLILCAAPTPAANNPGIGQTVLQAVAGALRDRQLGLASARQAAARVLALRAAP